MRPIHSLPRDAFSLLPGFAQPRHRTLTGCQVEVGFWEAALDEATEELLGAEPREMQEARRRLNAAYDRLIAAEARRNRVAAEERNERWLRLAVIP